MLKRYSQLFVTLMVLVDAAIIAAGWHLTYFLRMLREAPADRLGPYYAWYLPLLPVVVLSYLLAYRLMGLYRPRREQSVFGELGTIAVSSVVGMLLLLAVVFFLAQYSVFSRQVVGLFPVVNTVLTFGSRLAVRSALRALRRSSPSPSRG